MEARLGGRARPDLRRSGVELDGLILDQTNLKPVWSRSVFEAERVSFIQKKGLKPVVAICRLEA